MTPPCPTVVSHEPGPGDDPRSLLELVDGYLARRLQLHAAMLAGASRARCDAIRAQLGPAGDLVAGRIGGGTVAIRSGWCLIAVDPAHGGPPSILARRIDADLDQVAALEREREYETTVLDLARRLASGEDLSGDERACLAATVGFSSDAEPAECVAALAFFPGRQPPRDMAEFGALARELAGRARGQAGAGVRPGTPADVGPFEDDDDVPAPYPGSLAEAIAARPGLVRYLRGEPPAESTGPRGPDLDPLPAPQETTERFE